MDHTDDQPRPTAISQSNAGGWTRRRKPRRRFVIAVLALATVVLLLLAAASWLGTRANTVRNELDAAAELSSILKADVAADNAEAASSTAERLRSHTVAAREAVEDPLWTLASAIPGLGQNFSAVAEVARSADDVSALGVTPLVKVFESLNWDEVLPSASGANLEPLKTAAPSVSSAAHAVRVSAERLDRIDTRSLLPEVSEPLARARNELKTVTSVLDASADAANMVPGMLGADGARNYLLMIQNNAEARASGGIPGALAILNVDSGRLSLGKQSSASEIGVMLPALQVDPQQQEIYSARLGKFMQDVNLTPDFPTAASTAQAIWERKTGQQVNGVVSIDPVALGYLLEATGPVKIDNPELLAMMSTEMPTELSGENVVTTLLSDVYAKIDQPQIQDAYFASVAQEIFAALSSGNGDAEGLIEGFRRGSAEGRVLVWSKNDTEQAVLGKYALSGSVTGSSASPAQFGVYFNDGTGAKMDYYVKRSVQLTKECPRDGYEQTTVRITSTNTAPSDAATSLPAYVTGDGVFGVPPGSVQTNIVAYGPAQANVETAKLDGQKTEFAPHLHGSRPVGILAIRLAPGESKTVSFTFGKIVQHTEPKLVVTPTVQDVKDVTLPTQTAGCG